MSLPTSYQSYIHLSRYARFRDDLGRRETWAETVDRLIDFWRARFSDMQSMQNFQWAPLRRAIYDLDVMPSMRSLMTAGAALELDNVAGYNCSYTPIDSVRAFDEILYILMCGTGVGFSVERQYTNRLPPLPASFAHVDAVIEVADSKIGWAQALRQMLSHLWSGRIPRWDVSRVRPAGARLKTFGGRASGPDPLVALFRHCCYVLPQAAGRRLTSLECHDLVCHIADCVVVGGVRRSALISLSNLSDDRMRNAKSGAWWERSPQRAIANNSVAYTEKPEVDAFMREWLSLYDSKSGERGMFSRPASQIQAARNGRRDANREFGTNPCSEIILRPRQFCNLSEVVVREDDTLLNLLEKVKFATILGTMQASLVDFRYLSPEWKRNTEEEALLGVSLTGIMDHPLLSNASDPNLASALDTMRQQAIKVNKRMAARLGINQAAAITCVKPSGTVSQLVDSGSGIHPRYARFYLRTVRADKSDPLSRLMRDQGVYVEDDVANKSADVFYFPQRSPDHAVLRHEMTAIQQLELWRVYQEHWCEHKPSITVYVREHEWVEVGAWVYRHFDRVSGVSFLPYSDSEHTYRQAPYQEISEAAYNEWVSKTPATIEWSLLGSYEAGVDHTTGSQELACVAGACEIDMPSIQKAVSTSGGPIEETA
ncbi:MAG: ribonucleoside-triphosphate reductase [Desulfurellales bacterium]|nr:MAG: ribonucleoside-triphosphate reductase [Desulfurellales bacterium]